MELLPCHTKACLDRFKVRGSWKSPVSRPLCNLTQLLVKGGKAGLSWSCIFRSVGTVLDSLLACHKQSLRTNRPMKGHRLLRPVEPWMRLVIDGPRVGSPQPGDRSGLHSLSAACQIGTETVLVCSPQSPRSWNIWSEPLLIIDRRRLVTVGCRPPHS